jgi:hypothetical protein
MNIPALAKNLTNKKPITTIKSRSRVKKSRNSSRWMFDKNYYRNKLVRVFFRGEITFELMNSKNCFSDCVSREDPEI